MSKTYPETITLDGTTLSKLPDEFYLELQPGVSRSEADNCLKERGVLGRRADGGGRARMVERFNRSAGRSRWLVHAAKGKRSMAQVLPGLEKEKVVAQARPIYCRRDLKYPTGFSFNDEILVRPKAGVTEAALQRCLRKAGVAPVEGPRGELGHGVKLVRLLDKKKQNPYEAAQALLEAEAVEWARPNLLQLHPSLLAVPNDVYFLNQWNLRNTGQVLPDGNIATAGCDINIEPAWDISKGSPLVVIAMLDTGCDLEHPDLAFHLVQPERWYDAHDPANPPADDCGHGTACAGIAAALTNSLTAQGVAGVGWHCRILPVRVVYDNGTTTDEATIVGALNWARTHHARVINMSWHWDFGSSQVDQALQDCANASIVLCAGAGDYGGIVPGIAYPARNPNVIAVGATNQNDRRCKGGIGGDWPNMVLASQHGPELSVVAPGIHLWTTDLHGTSAGYNLGTAGDAAGDYFQDFGFGGPVPDPRMGATSGAAAHVAGLAGLILAYNPTLTPAQVRSIVENTADDQVGNPAEDTPGRDNFMGNGRINAGEALLEAQTNHPFTPADVYIRDSLNDSGAEPYVGWDLCFSPDIIVRNTPVANPATAFADMTVDPGSDNVEIGNDNYIYLRVHNQGTSATDIHARVYFAPLNTTCAPDQWQYIGQLDIYNVAAGSSAVSPELLWAHVPDPGAGNHFCLIASIEGARDPHPDPAGISDAAAYCQFIRDHNNVCYRNLVFQNLLPDSVLPMPFQPGGFSTRREHYDLRIEREGLAQRAQVRIKLPRSLFQEAHVHLEGVVERVDHPLKGFRTFELVDEKRPVIKGLAIGRRELAQLEIHVPAEARPGEEYKLVVQQLFQGEPIGGFQLAGKVADPAKTKFVAVRGSQFVHRADCAELKKSPPAARLPFDSLAAARVGGYDAAPDCLTQPFAARDVSYRLARKVLYFVNMAELPEDLEQAVKQGLERQGKAGAHKKGFGLETARQILEARERQVGFRSLKEIEAIAGVGQERFMELVNAFK